MMLCGTRRWALVFVVAIAGWTRAQDVGALKLPLREGFDGSSISSDWTQSISAGNSLAVRDGELVISAKGNTHAHLSRPCGIDGFRATVALKTDNSATWAPSLFLYWDENNSTQVTYRPGSFAPCVPYVGRRENGGFVETYGTLDTDMGETYHYSVAEGAIVPNPATIDTAKTWLYIGVEIDAKNVRPLMSDDGGKTWTVLREMPRDNPVYAKPPKLLVLGKGVTDPIHGLHKPNLTNDHPADPGQMAESRFKDLRIVPLSEVASAPAKRVNVPMRDELGEKILAGKDDPSFDSVAGIFPPLKYGRELIGVKDHKDDFTVLPDGSISCGNGYVYLDMGKDVPRLGHEDDLPHKRLHKGWQPIVVTEWERDGLKFEETAFGHSENFVDEGPIYAYVKLKIANPSGDARAMKFSWRRQIDALEPVAMFDFSVPAGGEKSVYLKIPFTLDGKLEQPSAADFDALLASVSTYWDKLLSTGASIDVPEERVANAYRAWQAFNCLNVDKVKGVYQPQDCSHVYPLVYGISAALYCRQLDDWNYHADAQRYLESLLTFVEPDGTFIVNYGLPDAGALLIAMAHHYHATGDAEWLKGKAPIMVKMADRFLARRLESRSTQNPADKWYGLVFEKPYCDYLEKSYNIVSDLTLAGGLIDAGAALKEVGIVEEGERFRIEGESYRRDILAVMKRSAIERDGQKIIPMFPQTQALLKAVDYTGMDYYGLQAGQILEKGMIDPNGWEAKSFVDMLEKRGGLILGTCRFAGGIDHAYTFGYWFNCLQRGEAKKVLLGFYTSLAYGMTRDTYSGVEVTFLKSGRNYVTLPHLYSGTQQLNLLKDMLCYEDGDTLMLGNAIPRPWLADGKHVAMKKMNTKFGDVSFALESQAAKGQMTLTIDPPTRHAPNAIRVRIRHPDGKLLQSVNVKDGSAEASVDGEYVVIKNAKSAVACELKF